MAGFFLADKTDDITVIRLTFNEINLEEREELKNDFVNIASSGESKFVIDFSKVGFLSSLVIATVIFFAKEVEKHQGTVKLCSLRDEALNVARVTHLDKAFEIYDTEHDATESFQVSR